MGTLKDLLDHILVSNLPDPQEDPMPSLPEPKAFAIKMSPEELYPNAEEREEAFADYRQHSHDPNFEGCEAYVEVVWNMGTSKEREAGLVQVQCTPELHTQYPELSVGCQVWIVKAFDGCMHSQVIGGNHD